MLKQEHKSFCEPKKGESAADIAPELIQDWDNKNNQGTLYCYTKGSHYIAHWICHECGHEWYAQIASRACHHHGCPECGKRKISKMHKTPKTGKTFADVYRAFVIDWDFEKNVIKPDEIKYASNEKVHWKCHHCGYEWVEAPFARTKHLCIKCHINDNEFNINKRQYNQANKQIPRGTKLFDAFPELESEWDFDKNELSPYELTFASCRKAWWRCETCGYEWQAVIANRTKHDSGCPICANRRKADAKRKPQPGKSLAELYPNLLSEWDYDKNNGINPFDIKPQSNLYIWWKCKNGHSWRQKPNVRVGQGCGCPECARQNQASRQATPHENQSFADLFPDIASEWAEDLNSGYSPYDFKPYSMARVWWRCTKCGHTWKMPIAARTFQKQGCSKCAIVYKTSFPEQAVLFFMRKDIDSNTIGQYRVPNPNGGEYSIDVYIPSINTAIEYDGKHWHKNKQADQRKEDVILNAGIDLFRIIEDDNDFVDGNHIHFTCNDHNNSRKDNAKLSLAITQLEGMLGYNGADIDVEKYTQDIMRQYRFSRPENNIADNHPDLMRDWDYDKNSLDPYLISEKSSLRVHWKCHECGHEWETPVRNRTINGTGCRKCRMREHNQKLGKLKHERHLRELEEQKHKNNIS